MYGSKLSVVAVLTAAIGCGSTPRPAPEAPSPPPAIEPAPPPARSPAFDALVMAVEDLPARLDDRSHAALVLALRRLANAMDHSADAGDLARAERVRTIAKSIESSDRRSPKHADLISAALQEALAVIERRLPDPASSDVRAGYIRAVTAARRIDPAAPLLQLRAETYAAFVAVAHALLVANGAPSPFTFASEPRERDAARLRDHARAASTAVGEVATTSGTVALRAAADAFDAIALAVETAPVSATLVGELDDLASVIRFEAARLRQTGDFGFERADRIKAGVTSALDALDRLARERPVVEASPMLGRARAATDAIDGSGMFEFQRAAIQEALRTTVDALLVLSACDGAACGPITL